MPIVAHRDGSRSHELAELRQVLTLLPERDGPDRIDPRLGRLLGLAHDEADRGLVIRHGIGVRHGAHRGEATGRSSHRAGRDRLQVFLSGLTQVHVEVDQPRRDDFVRGVDHRGVRRNRHVLADGLDLPVLNQHVGGAVSLARRIDHPPALDQDSTHDSSPAFGAVHSGEPPERR